MSLDVQCVDDEALFALARGALPGSELPGVEAHLRDCADCRAVLAEASRSLASHAPERPAQVARYEVRELIGAGASGVVYRAFDPRLQRTVALKVLRPDPAHAPDLAARVLREAQAMARLSAPQVVAIYDVGVEAGAVYLVMEHVLGGTLATWLRDERSADDILAVFAEAGRGLLAAHEKGLVHRDFKPENVLVDGAQRARVTDFGLAREAAADASVALHPEGAAQLYAPTRGLVGTPAYLSPELFAGQPASAQSDQFAFCVALYTALFERHPFRAGEGITLEQLAEAARAHALASGAGALSRSARGRRIHAVLARGLHPDPARRFADMGELLARLGAAARPRAARVVLATLAASLLVLLGLLGVRSLEETSAEVAPARATDAPAPAPAAAETFAEPIHPSPAEVSGPDKPPARKRARKKSRDVRYQDWLKDPF